VATSYFTHAMRDAIAEAMRDDPTVFVFGEDVDKSVLGPTQGLVDEFTSFRVRNTPISEQAVLGSLIGASQMGLRPVMDFMFAGFFYVAMDQIINQAAHMRYMSGGRLNVPIVVIGGVGPSGQAGSQHSESPHGLLMAAAGLKVVAPSTPADAKGLMTAAIADPDPVVFLMDITLTGTRGEVPEGRHVVPLGSADVKRAGRDVTVVAMTTAVPAALEAADRLAADGIEVEVIDPRTLAPLDMGTILESVSRTKHLIVAEQGRRTCGLAAEISAAVVEQAWDVLAAPPLRLTWPDVPVPYTPTLELACLVGTEDIVQGVRRVTQLSNARV
jgi:pyruvate dehydrogenase E1 component beta subunit